MAASKNPVFNSRDITPGIVNMVKTVLPAFREIRPDRAKIEFGLEFTLENGSIQPVIVKGVDNGNMRITLEWDSEKE